MKQKGKFKETEIGEIPEDWEEKSLEKFCDVEMGQSPPSKTYNSLGEGKPFLQGIRNFGSKYPIIDTWTVEPKKLAKKNSVLFSVRAPVGEVNIANKEICIGRGLSALYMKNGNNDFLYYTLKYFKDRILRFQTGTVYDSINKETIKKLRLIYPPNSEQIAIAKVLSDLDTKIELNQQMDKTLEEIGQAIFERWFVDFEFPNNEGNPYKSSGGEMVYNEEAGKKIPAGWSAGDMENFVQIKGGGTPSTKNPIFWGGNIDWCTPKDLSTLDSSILLDTERKITEDGLKKISSGLLPKGTVLLSSRAPIGYIAISEVPVSVNQGFIAITCNSDISNYYIFYWLRNNLNYIKQIAGGSTFSEISKSTFRKIKITVPSKEVISLFDSIMEDIHRRRVTLQKENKNLSQIRDLLLPKLMSGKIRVPVENEEINY